MDFPSNSRNPRPDPDEKPKATNPEPEESDIEPVLDGASTTRRKRPLGKRFVESFFSGEAPKSVMGYVVAEVLIPAAKDMIRDAGQEALDRILYRNGGDGGSRSRRRRDSPYVSYDRYASNKTTVRRDDPRERPSLSNRARAMHDFDEIVIPTRAEANEIIDRMYDRLKRYEQVTLAEFYKFTGNTPEYTDENWGWTDLRGVEPKKVRDGFIVDLPRPEHLK